MSSGMQFSKQLFPGLHRSIITNQLLFILTCHTIVYRNEGTMEQRTISQCFLLVVWHKVALMHTIAYYHGSIVIEHLNTKRIDEGSLYS